MVRGTGCWGTWLAQWKEQHQVAVTPLVTMETKVVRQKSQGPQTEVPPLPRNLAPALG